MIDPAALPYASQAVDTRSGLSNASAPSFPCYGKLLRLGGGQAAPSKVVWFSFTPEATGTYRLDTLGSAPADYDTILGVYTGGCSSLASVSGVCKKKK